MTITRNEVAAANQVRRDEELSKSAVGGLIESGLPVAGAAASLGTALVSGGSTGLVVAGSIVAGLGIVDWFRKLGSSKVNENLEALGQATEDALNRVENVLKEHGTSIDEIKRRLESEELRNAMASASLQALRTTQIDRLNRLALILSNGVKENDLEPESTDEMMRVAVELTNTDIEVLGVMYQMQRRILTGQRNVQQGQRINHIQREWQEWWGKNIDRYQGTAGMAFNNSCARLQAAGLISSIGAKSFAASPTTSNHELLLDGMKFYERLQEIGTVN